MVRSTVFLIGTVVLACAAPTPVPSPNHQATGGFPSAKPTQPDHAALRGTAGARIGVAPDQLVLVEDGFVASRFRLDDTLELVWVGPADDGLDDRLLAAVSEQRGTPDQSIGSVHAAVCPPELGLARTRYLFGQETTERTLELGGVAALGGAVAGGTYVFAVAGESFDATTRWVISNESGLELSSGDEDWFTLPSQTSSDQCTITSEH